MPVQSKPFFSAEQHPFSSIQGATLFLDVAKRQFHPADTSGLRLLKDDTVLLERIRGCRGAPPGQALGSRKREGALPFSAADFYGIFPRREPRSSPGQAGIPCQHSLRRPGGQRELCEVPNASPERTEGIQHECPATRKKKRVRVDSGLPVRNTLTFQVLGEGI
ncbi:uncharacterized protein GJ701_016443 isoform 1-T1 [Geothlypis trichas]